MVVVNLEKWSREGFGAARCCVEKRVLRWEEAVSLLARGKISVDVLL